MISSKKHVFFPNKELSWHVFPTNAGIPWFGFQGCLHLHPGASGLSPLVAHKPLRPRQFGGRAAFLAPLAMEPVAMDVSSLLILGRKSSITGPLAMAMVNYSTQSKTLGVPQFINPCSLIWGWQKNWSSPTAQVTPRRKFQGDIDNKKQRK